MPQETTLTQRIKAEFDARQGRLKASEANRSKETDEREARLKQFAAACESLKGVWRPRLEEFAKQFGDQLKVTPSISPSHREARMDFNTDLATVTLTIRVSTDEEVRKIRFEYDLQIIPILMEYQRHASMETSLEKPDAAAFGKWLEDRLLDCVRVYLSMQDNEFYLNRSLVEDPISKVRFHRQAAAATLEQQGGPLYFATTETLRQYKEKMQIK